MYLVRSDSSWCEVGIRPLEMVRSDSDWCGVGIGRRWLTRGVADTTDRLAYQLSDQLIGGRREMVVKVII
ncbi:hypothetical protein MLP_06860 [Microlunatus phosphovorus NM-1]|uniref:Uncharacterized protein n=1 Tax=Microlunatus phosphovorus (strain ATCC 700054 / DSM 10555 / JCM 9379 / NBRC 101784 / NCIMB 13414 / VKM Ac-1990 / NM-1) TaxID=1032480 RepID=F5XL12_MICPN|nr:hypothetical protein MLP_06860 [Microlunatus phosphovorus NM-1]